jgi:hypothetical protein
MRLKKISSNPANSAALMASVRLKCSAITAIHQRKLSRHLVELVLAVALGVCPAIGGK